MMETKFLGLRTVGYKVGDLQKAKDWYTKVFDTMPYFDEPFYVGFNIAGYELGLMPAETPSSDKADSVVLYWGVDDINKSYSRLLELGAITHEPPQNVGGEIMVATVKDPWNNVIGIIYNPDFKL
jgi:lactoylglutathione lyase